MNLFAVQILRGETDKDVAEIVLKRAAASGVSCKTLEVLDTLEIGATRYVRLRSDLPSADDVLASLHAAGRSVVLTAKASGHPVRSGAKTGQVPFAKMQFLPRTSPVVYRGNALPYWDRQFQP